MKRFNFNEILKCYDGKKLLKSYVENELKNKEKRIYFSPNISLFLLFTGNFHQQVPLLFVFSGRLQQKEFLTAFCPHILTFCTMPIPRMNLTQFTPALYTAILLF